MKPAPPSERAQGPALIWCPFPDTVSAEIAAANLIDEALVACANILAPMHSMFIWRGKREVRSETGVLFKTDAALVERAIVRIAELHPDTEPAVLGWRCDAALPATAAWLGELVRNPGF